MGLIHDKGIEEALRVCANSELHRMLLTAELTGDRAIRELFFGYVLGLKARCEDLKRSHDTLLTFTVGPLQLESAVYRSKVGHVRRLIARYRETNMDVLTHEVAKDLEEALEND